MGKVLTCWILVAIYCFSLGETQNVDKLCHQVYTDCQACSVFQNECANRPPSSQRPQTPNRPTTLPAEPSTTPQPPRPTCLENGKGCSTSDECCNRNCKVESISMSGNVYTIKVCRSATRLE